MSRPASFHSSVSQTSQNSHRYVPKKPSLYMPTDEERSQTKFDERYTHEEYFRSPLANQRKEKSTPLVIHPEEIRVEAQRKEEQGNRRGREKSRQGNWQNQGMEEAKSRVIRQSRVGDNEEIGEEVFLARQAFGVRTDDEFYGRAEVYDKNVGYIGVPRDRVVNTQRRVRQHDREAVDYVSRPYGVDEYRTEVYRPARPSRHFDFQSSQYSRSSHSRDISPHRFEDMDESSRSYGQLNVQSKLTHLQSPSVLAMLTPRSFSKFVPPPPAPPVGSFSVDAQHAAGVSSIKSLPQQKSISGDPLDTSSQLRNEKKHHSAHASPRRDDSLTLNSFGLQGAQKTPKSSKTIVNHVHTHNFIVKSDGSLDVSTTSQTFAPSGVPTYIAENPIHLNVSILPTSDKTISVGVEQASIPFENPTFEETIRHIQEQIAALSVQSTQQVRIVQDQMQQLTQENNLLRAKLFAKR